MAAPESIGLGGARDLVAEPGPDVRLGLGGILSELPRDQARRPR